jgi:hypothetical protein
MAAPAVAALPELDDIRVSHARDGIKMGLSFLQLPWFDILQVHWYNQSLCDRHGLRDTCHNVLQQGHLQRL